MCFHLSFFLVHKWKHHFKFKWYALLSVNSLMECARSVPKETSVLISVSFLMWLSSAIFTSFGLWNRKYVHFRSQLKRTFKCTHVLLPLLLYSLPSLHTHAVHRMERDFFLKSTTKRMLMNRKERVSIEKWSNKLGATTNGNFAEKKCATKVILTQDECRHVLMLTLFQTIQGLFFRCKKKAWNAVRSKLKCNSTKVCEKKRLAIFSTCLRFYNRVILIIILFNIFFQHTKSMISGDRRDSSSTLHEWKNLLLICILVVHKQSH